jgi:hypothetical protein
VAVEVPTEFFPWSRVQWSHRSDSELAALMETVPFGDPDAPWPEVQRTREALVDCFERLCDEDQFLVEAIWFERLTVRALALRLGLEKSQTHRLCRRAVIRLGVLCAEHPVLQDRYGLRPVEQCATVVQPGLQSQPCVA